MIDQLVLVADPGLNLIVGGNGAGKTSILEAIYLAGRGRTFRHSAAGPMIRRGAEAATIVVDLLDERSDTEHRLGLRRGKSDFVCRLDGDDVKKRSTLAETLPVQFIGSQPQVFLDQGPDIRRRFMDMGLFHVEHAFLPVYSECYRSLKQRNAALKAHDARSANAWNNSFFVAAEAVHAFRASFIESLMISVSHRVDQWKLGFEISYKYRKGWRDGEELLCQLIDRLDQDMQMGFTSVGPQRADVELFANGVNASKTLSRGQQKMLVFALNLALADVQQMRTGTKPVLMIDDLAAELDVNNQRKVFDALEDLSAQVFVTSISEPSALGDGARSPAMFHVEHGRLQDSA